MGLLDTTARVAKKVKSPPAGRKPVPRVPVRRPSPQSKPLGAAIAGTNSDGSPRYVYGPPKPLKHKPGAPVVFPRNPTIAPRTIAVVPGRASAADASGLSPNNGGNPPIAFPSVSGETPQDIIDRVAVEQKVANVRQKQKAHGIATHEPGWMESGFDQVMGLLLGAGPLAVDAAKQFADINVTASPVINATKPEMAENASNRWKKRSTDYALAGATFYKDAATAIATGDTKWLKENYVNLGLQALGAVGSTEAALGYIGKTVGMASKAATVSKLNAERKAAEAANDVAGARQAADAAKAVERVFMFGNRAAGKEAAKLASTVMSRSAKRANQFLQWTRTDTRPGSPRLRPEKRIELPRRRANSDQEIPGVNDLIIPPEAQRLRSGGVLRRSVQKRVTEPLGRRLTRPTNTGTIKIPFREREIPLPFSYDRAWNKAHAKIAEGIAYTSREAADKAASDIVRAMMDSDLRKIKPGDAADVAAWFKIRGVDPLQAAKMWEEHLAGIDARGARLEPAVRQVIEENIAKARSVDPRLVSDVPPAPHDMGSEFGQTWQRTQSLSRIGHDVSQTAGRNAVEAGVLTEGQQVLGSTVGPRVMAGERVLKDAVSTLAAEERASRIAADRASASGALGAAAHHLDEARRLRRRRLALTHETLYGNHDNYTRAYDAVEEARAQVRAAKTVKDRDRAVGRLHQARQALARETRRGRNTTWTQENYNPETAPKSAYIEDYSALEGGSRKPKFGRPSGPGFAPSAQKRTGGHLLRTGQTMVGNTRASIAGSAESLARSEKVAIGAQELVDTVAARRTRPDGTTYIVTGREAEDLVKASQGLYTVVNKRMLDRVYAIGNRTLEGEKLKDLQIALNEGDIKDQIAIPTSALDAWRDVMGSRRNGFDAVNQVFKSTVLPFKPGWYFQNFIGNWLQFFLQGGPDMQALRVGNSAAGRALMPDRLRVGLVGESAPNVATRGGNPAAHGASAVLGKFFGFNDSVERWSKTASYMAAAKGAIKKDPILGKSGRMSDAQLMDALKEVADAAGRNEPWAKALVQDAVRTSQDFLGDYSRYNHFERKYLRRVLPFYAWIRTITRLALMLPVKYPVRTALLAMGLKAASDLNGGKSIYDMFGMAAVDVAGRIVPTGGTMPSDTLITLAEHGKNAAAQSNDVLDFVAHAGTEAVSYTFQNSSPYVQFPAVAALASTPIGIPLQFSPGAGGRIVTSPTGRQLRQDPATGDYGEMTPRYGIGGILAFTENQFPPLKVAGQMIAGARRPYSDVAPHDIIRWGIGGRDAEQEKRLFAPAPRTGRPLTRDWITTALAFTLDSPAFVPDWNAAYRRWRQTQRSGRAGEASARRNENRPRG